MKRVTFTHIVAWRDPESRIVYHIDEHKVLHVLDADEPCDLMNFLVPDDIDVEPGDWWNGNQESPQFSKQMFLGLGPPWDREAPDLGRAGFNALPSPSASDSL